MNIIHIGNFGRGWDNSVCDELHISESLVELGHTVVNIQREQWRERIADDEQGKWHPHPTFILLAQWDGFTDDFIPTIRDYYSTVPIVFWCYDYQADGQEWHERLIAESDLYLSKRIADYKYPNWRWLSQDFAPKFLDKFDEPISAEKYERPYPKNIDVLFTGSYLDWATERNETIRAVNQKFNLVVHSVNDWPFLEKQPPIMDEGLPELYARARVILSIDHTLEAGYWSDRNAQIMACGRRPLFRYVPLSEARFGDRVDYFYSVEDCLEKIANWQERPTNADGLFVKDRVRDLLTIVESIL